MNALDLAHSGRTDQTLQSLAQLSADSASQALSLHGSMDKLGEQVAAMRARTAERTQREAPLIQRLTALADQLSDQSAAAAELRGIASSMSADMQATCEQVSGLSQDVAGVCRDQQTMQVSALPVTPVRTHGLLMARQADPALCAQTQLKACLKPLNMDSPQVR